MVSSASSQLMGTKYPLPGPFFPDALHGVQKTRFAVEFLLPGMAHGTRTCLDVALEQFLPRLVLAAVVLVDGVIGFDCEDLAILHVAFQNASRIPAAICRTRGVEDALAFATLLARIYDALLVHTYLPLLLQSLTFALP